MLILRYVRQTSIYTNLNNLPYISILAQIQEFNKNHIKKNINNNILGRLNIDSLHGALSSL